MAFYLKGENIPFTLEHQHYRFRDYGAESYTVLYTQPEKDGACGLFERCWAHTAPPPRVTVASPPASGRRLRASCDVKQMSSGFQRPPAEETPRQWTAVSSPPVYPDRSPSCVPTLHIPASSWPSSGLREEDVTAMHPDMRGRHRPATDFIPVSYFLQQNKDTG